MKIVNTAHNLAEVIETNGKSPFPAFCAKKKKTF